MVNLPLFSSPTVKNITWITTGAQSVFVRVDGNEVSTIRNGSVDVSGYGRHNIQIGVRANRRSTLIIEVDGAQLTSRDNHTEETTITGYQDCAEYSISSTGTRCRPGYNQVNRPRYRTRQRWRQIRSGRVTDRGEEIGEWQSTPPPIPPARSGSGSTYREWLQGTIEEENNYFCVPSQNCQGEPITETTEGNSGNYSYTFSVFNERTQAEQDAIDLLNQQQQQPQPPSAPAPAPVVPELNTEPIEEAIQNLADQIQENTQTAQDLLNQNSGAEPTLKRPENTEDSKYRVITPLQYERVNGQIVPKTRFETVRFLSPDQVSNFISRGYTVESVNQDTPTSSSKPYGKTLIERAQILTPPSIDSREIFDKRRRTGQEIIAARRGEDYTRPVYKQESRRVIR